MRPAFLLIGGGGSGGGVMWRRACGLKTYARGGGCVWGVSKPGGLRRRCSPIITVTVFHHGRVKVWVDWEASAVRAMMPPSPRLSARMIKITYFSVTVMFNNQKIVDIAPKTLSGVAGMLRKIF
jgi:hypothetical protein